MKTKFIVLPALCWLAACAQPSSEPPSGPPPAPPSAAASPPPSPAQMAPGRWDVEWVRCSDLLAASDDDRAAAAMFYYGYLAAKAGIRVIDVSRIDGNISKVMHQCEATPDMTVPQAFRTALRPAAR